MNSLVEKCERWLDSGSFQEVVDAVNQYRIRERGADSPEMAELELRKAVALVHLARKGKEENSADPGKIEAWQSEAMKIFASRHSLFSGDIFLEQMMAETAMETGRLSEALTAYRQLKKLEPGNGDWSAGEAACLEQLVHPPAGESFRARTRRMWSDILNIRSDLEKQVSIFVVERLPHAVISPVPEAEITLVNTGKRFTVYFNPREDPALGLLCSEVARQVPEQMKDSWDFSGSPQQEPGLFSPAGWAMIDLSSIHVQYEQTPMGTLRFSLYLKETVEANPWEEGTLMFRLGETSTRKALEQCLHERLGGLFTQRYIQECRAVLSMPEDTLNLLGLPDRLEEDGYPVPLPLDTFADRLDAYEMTGDPEKMSWRTGVTRGWTVFPELLLELSAGTCGTLDGLRRHGAWAGSVCIPLASLPAGGDLAEALLGDLVLELEQHLSSSIWHYCGYGIGEKEEYLDFLAWDAPAFLSAVRICLQDAGIPGICFRSMFAESPPLPLENWPLWNFPEWETLEVSPVSPAASLPEDAWRRPGYPLSSRAHLREEEKEKPAEEGKFEDLEPWALRLNCGKHRRAVDACLRLLKAEDYDGAVKAVRSSRAESEGRGSNALFLLKMLEAMALYRKGKTLLRSQGKLTSESASCLRGAYNTATQYNTDGRSGVMTRIAGDCLELLGGIYFQLETVSGENVSPETARWLTQAGQRAAVPLDPIPLRQRISDTWKAFQAREEEFRKALNADPRGGPEICERMTDVFNFTFCNQSLRASRTSKGKYRLNFLTDGEFALALALGELIRRAPPALKKLWVFTAGQPDPLRTVPAGDTVLTPMDIYVLADRTGGGWDFAMWVPRCAGNRSFRTQAGFEELQYSAWYLVKMTLGELWTVRNRRDVCLMPGTQKPPACSLMNLPSRMNMQGAEVPMSLDRFLNTFEMHELRPEDGGKCVWRSGHVFSFTCCPYFLRDMYSGDISGLKWLTFAGAVPGSICLPRSDTQPPEKGDRFLLTLGRDLPRRVPQSFWKYLGWGCSSDMMYLDFLAWDLASFLDAVEKYLGVTASMAVIHVWHWNSPAVPLKRWRSWKFPDWKEGFPLA